MGGKGKGKGKRKRKRKRKGEGEEEGEGEGEGERVFVKCLQREDWEDSKVGGGGVFCNTRR